MAPPAGAFVKPEDPIAGSSTVSEPNGNEKTGSGSPNIGQNPLVRPLDRVRVDSTARALSTNQGVPVADNQHSLKAGLRGPTLLEDFILREKITHFDHERIPERIVHARGSAAHGYFECYRPLTQYTRASIFSEAGKQTPVFVRFSTVVGERGSTDTARDVRGFAVKFYTDEGNWDLVGNNIPIFFIQDAMKFPDLIHAAKPEPHFAMPQAATAHDTFWDFVSLMPESTAMLLWAMSDRAIPRSYRMMQGFGVHTFRFVNAAGESHFVKFHWSPAAGTHSLVWDEAVKISGADPDFHRRDLWEAIEAGAYPEYELGVQIFTEEQAEGFSFDVLDATKIVPEELVPVFPVGKLVLNRNPDNFFAETEQVAFCTAHIVPGLDFTNDPLLAGRIHSYHDTQISRLGGPNFHEIPINAPVAQVHNNQRDGMHRQAINRGRVAYEPNSLGGGCPFQAGTTGFVSFPEPRAGRRPQGPRQAGAVRRPLHPGDAVLEQPDRPSRRRTSSAPSASSCRGCRRRRSASAWCRACATSRPSWPRRSPRASACASCRSRCRRRWPARVTPEVTASPALSLFARPGDGGIRTRKVAILRRRRLRRASPSARWPGGWPAKARCRASSARARRGRGDVGRARSTPTPRSRRRRASSTTRSSCPTARRRRSAARQRTGARVPEGPVPPLQDDPRRSARAAGVLRAAGIPETLPDGHRRSRAGGRRQAGAGPSTPSSPRSRSTGISSVKPIPRACEHARRP